ncbi:hypothetical protein GlitD10_2459 [Gloeomargarita lithophora Alchichica-D10]|uniref:DUF565 domain-containing protein n=1 Tax=Gloeomargarita lithophora Alchichica-D10 TaxID=1188229 RepID=A0A1J0AFW2_9CYAN|nr:DUF565 domain-containing protein [Gloeomargarita lithophora]APB34795.1 hypothetical protein GlitD10_2459 [Gloeomargarita lithophora Alchichica-D10]
MQQTRLNQIANQLGQTAQGWLKFPLHAWLLYLVFFFLGNFLASAITTGLGALAQFDIVAMAVLLAATEILNRWVYSQRRVGWLLSLLNMLKVGFIGGMYLDALKLGS